MYNPDNVFAKILRGDLPAKCVYEDDDVLAFNDIHPAAPIHVLVISKGAYVSFDDFSARASEQEIYRFWQSIYKTRKTLNISAKGYRLITNTGIDGGQEVPHFHVHILAGKALGAKVCA